MTAIYQVPRLFAGSCAALSTVAVTVATRANALPQITAELGLTNEQMGSIAGTAFWGFALGLLAGPFCDWLGMGRILRAGFIMHVTGLTLSLFAQTYSSLYLGTLAIGLGNGLLASVCNPLVANLFKQNRAKHINRFHAWYPIASAVSGLLLLAVAGWQLNWRAQLALMLVPMLAYATLFWGQTFPPTERKQMGVSARGMLQACLNPFFLLLLFCIALANPTEVATTQWLRTLLAHTGLPGGLLLFLLFLGMGLGRYFAAGLVRRLGTLGLLAGAALVALGSLEWLYLTQGMAAGLAIVVFGYGVGFLIPTTYAVLAEQMPQAGSLGTSLLAAVGMTGTSQAVRLLGAAHDERLAHLGPQASEALRLAAGAVGLQQLALLPTVLLVMYAGLWLWQRRRPAHLAVATAGK
ncbi:MAG: MFS transporter [Bernardetiaceae bacterium]|jgi:MFS family permease|nr:MFS transporter [Bernardetiaceae bacterium]